PYVDFSGMPVSVDPFGEQGGTPGFPLPADLIKVIQLIARYADGSTSDVDVITERLRNNTNTHNLTAFINGNRIVPIRQPSSLLTGGWTDLWTNVATVTLTYLAVPTLTALTGPIVIPVVLHGALVAAVAAHLAQACPSDGPTAMSATEKRRFAAD